VSSSRLAVGVVATFLVLLSAGASFAQSPNQAVQIDCSAFRQESDGSWVATRETTIKIGTNTLTRSAGRVNGSINGVDLQKAIAAQCARVAPPAQAKSHPYAYTNWIMNKQSSAECTARGNELIRGFPDKLTAGETLFAYSDDFTFIIRCTPQRMIFFALVGPPETTKERNQAAQALLDDIFNKW
jgi:hypothetical protein